MPPKWGITIISDQQTPFDLASLTEYIKNLTNGTSAEIFLNSVPYINAQTHDMIYNDTIYYRAASNNLYMNMRHVTGTVVNNEVQYSESTTYFQYTGTIVDFVRAI